MAGLAITYATGNAGSSIQWGDAPTWVLAAIALAALIAAIAAYLKQAAAAQDVSAQVKLQGSQLTDQQEATRQLAEQARLQREALEDQRKASARQAEVLDAQLREMAQRERIIERQQAEDVALKKSSSMTAPPGIAPLPPQSEVHAGEIVNMSRRPIRDVCCRIERAPSEGLHDAALTGQLVDMGMPPGARVLIDQQPGSWLRLIRAGETWTFIFRYDTESSPDASVIARFTDDAGLHWQIDPDLHLAKLDNRDDW